MTEMQTKLSLGEVEHGGSKRELTFGFTADGTPTARWGDGAVPEEIGAKLPQVVAGMRDGAIKQAAVASHAAALAAGWLAAVSAGLQSRIVMPPMAVAPGTVRGRG